MSKSRSDMSRKKMDIFSTDWILNNYKFVLFLGFLGAIYINNSHQMEKKFRKVRKLEIEVNNLKTNYKSRLAQYASYQKPSKILSMGEAIGLNTNGIAPKKIVVKNQ